MRVEHKVVADIKPGHVVDVTNAFYEHGGVAMSCRFFGTHTEEGIKMILAGRRQRVAQVNQTVS